MFCKNCGRVLKDGSRFCPECGVEVIMELNTDDNTVPETNMSNNAQADDRTEIIRVDPYHNESNIEQEKKNDYDGINNGNVQLKMKNKKPVALWVGIVGILLIASIVISVVVITNASKKSEYDEMMDLGRKYLLELDYEQAAIAFEKAIEIDPKNKNAYIELAEVYTKQHNVEKAIELLEEATEKVEIPEYKDIISRKMVEIDGKNDVGPSEPLPTEAPTLVATPVVTTIPQVTPELDPESHSETEPTDEPVIEPTIEPTVTPEVIQKPTETPTPIPTITFNDEQINEAFEAYLKLIKKKKSTLDVPYANWDESAPETPRQTVAVLDVWGDETPELILAESKNVNSIDNPIEPLGIYTYKNGKVKKLFEREVTIQDCFFEYNLIFTKNKELYLYEVQGCDRAACDWIYLIPGKNITEKVMMSEYDGYEASGTLEDTYYNSEGNKISEKKYKKWKSEFDSSVVCSVFSTTKEYGDPIAMNYKEAISFFENWKSTKIIDVIEWYEKNYYTIGVKRLADEMENYEYTLMYRAEILRNNTNELYMSADHTIDISLDKDLMTKIAATASYACRDEYIAERNLGEPINNVDYYSINADNLKKEGVNLFGKELKTSFLSEDWYLYKDAYIDSEFGPVICSNYEYNTYDLLVKSVKEKKKGKSHTITKKIYFGSPDGKNKSSNAEIIYTIEKNSKSEFGYIITGINIRYTDL